MGGRIVIESQAPGMWVWWAMKQQEVSTLRKRLMAWGTPLVCGVQAGSDRAVIPPWRAWGPQCHAR